MAGSGSTGFQPEALLEKLARLNPTQQSIQTVSSYCTFFRKDARKVVGAWELDFSRSQDMQKKLALIYLANDVLQNSRKKGPQFLQEFYKILPKAIKHMVKHGDSNVHRAVTRTVTVWEERSVFGSLPLKPFQDAIKEAASAGSGTVANGQPSSTAAVRPLGGELQAISNALQAADRAASDSSARSQRASPALSQEWVQSTDADSLEGARRTLQQYADALLAEVQNRQKVIGLLQGLIGAQEAAKQAAQQQQGTCSLQMTLINQRMVSAPAGRPDVAMSDRDLHRSPEAPSRDVDDVETYSPSAEAPVPTAGPLDLHSMGSQGSRDQYPYTPSAPTASDYSPFAPDYSMPMQSMAMGSEQYPGSALNAAPVQRSHSQEHRDPRDPRGYAATPLAGPPPPPPAPEPAEGYSPGGEGDMDLSASLASDPGQATSYAHLSHLPGSSGASYSMPHVAAQDMPQLAGDGAGGWQSAPDGGLSMSQPVTSSAADMARQLATGGMNTDALLEALASLPKDAIAGLNL